MNLREALGHLVRSSVETTSLDALRVVGRYLGGQVTVGPEAVAVVVGREALEIQSGAFDVLGDRKVYVTGTITRGYRTVAVHWISGPPPDDVPLVVFVRRIVTGVTVRALLAEIPRVDATLAVTVVAAQATDEGVAAIASSHPGVAVHFAASLDTRTDP